MITTGRVIQMEDATGFPVAVKRWSKEESDKAKWEQRIMELVQGPGVPKLIRNFEDADHVYVVTEWISGVTLDRYVEESGGFLRSEQAFKIADKIFDILQRIHNSSQGTFVYTDLKPSNVMVKDREVFLVDFESVCPAGMVPVSPDEKTVVMGSRPFTAPEVFTGKIQPECDYYSLGTLMFFMLTGELWQGNSKMLKDDVLGDRILKLLDSDPGKRKNGIKMFSSVKDAEYAKPQSGTGRVSEKKRNIAEQRATVFFVSDNPRFAIEAVYEAAMRMNMKVGLFPMAEGDILPCAKGLGIRRIHKPVCFMESREAEKTFMQNSDTDQWLEKGLLMQPEGFGKLYISLIPPAKLMHHMKLEEWSLFCHWARRNFDVTVITGNLERDYIAFFSDSIILAPRPDSWETENARALGENFRENKHAINIKYVAWEYKEGVSLSLEKFAARVGSENYIGEIYHDSNRQMTENLEQLPYCFSMPEIIRQQYLDIMEKLTEGEYVNEKM